MEITLRNATVTARVDVKDLQLKKRVLLGVESVMMDLAISIAAHQTNAEGHTEGSYLRGYHEGAAARLGMFMNSIKRLASNQEYLMAEGREGDAVEAFIVNHLV